MKDEQLIGRLATGIGIGTSFTQLPWAKEQFVERVGSIRFLVPSTMIDDRVHAGLGAAETNGWHPNGDPNDGPHDCDAKCWRVSIDGKIDGAIVFPLVPDYPIAQVEVIAPVGLRDALGIEDGDAVTLTIKELTNGDGAKANAELWVFPLLGPTGGSGITAVDVIVVDIEDSDGRTGTGFSYVLGGGGATVAAAAWDMLERFVAGQEIVPPRALWRRLADLNGWARTVILPSPPSMLPCGISTPSGRMPLYSALGGVHERCPCTALAASGRHRIRTRRLRGPLNMPGWVAQRSNCGSPVRRPIWTVSAPWPMRCPMVSTSWRTPTRSAIWRALNGWSMPWPMSTRCGWKNRYPRMIPTVSRRSRLTARSQ